MKNLKLFLFCSLVVTIITTGLAQAGLPDFNLNLDSDYSSCAAIYFNNDMLVDEYSPRGKCQLEDGMKGLLTLAAVELSGKGTKRTKQLSFRVAIKNEATNTLWMYSNTPLEEVKLEDILPQLKKEDSIIFLTVDKKYSLPHHEIKVRPGC